MADIIAFTVFVSVYLLVFLFTVTVISYKPCDTFKENYSCFLFEMIFWALTWIVMLGIYVIVYIITAVLSASFGYDNIVWEVISILGSDYDSFITYSVFVMMIIFIIFCAIDMKKE